MSTVMVLDGSLNSAVGQEQGGVRYNPEVENRLVAVAADGSVLYMLPEDVEKLEPKSGSRVPLNMRKLSSDCDDPDALRSALRL